MKFYAVISFILCSFAYIFAENKALCVSLNDGTKATFTLAKKPVITFSAENVVISSDNFNTTYLKSDVKSFTFVPDENGNVNEIADNNSYYTFVNNIFSANADNILIYNISGQLIKTGDRIVSLQDSSNGIYIVKVNNQTIKIIKR